LLESSGEDSGGSTIASGIDPCFLLCASARHPRRSDASKQAKARAWGCEQGTLICGLLDRSQSSPAIFHSEGLSPISLLLALQTLTKKHEQALGARSFYAGNTSTRTRSFTDCLLRARLNKSRRRSTQHSTRSDVHFVHITSSFALEFRTVDRARMHNTHTHSRSPAYSLLPQTTCT